MGENKARLVPRVPRDLAARRLQRGLGVAVGYRATKGTPNMLEKQRNAPRPEIGVEDRRKRVATWVARV